MAAMGYWNRFTDLSRLVLFRGGKTKVYWSPYQKLTLLPRQRAGNIIAYQLTTNDSWYQQILNLSPEFVASHPQFFHDVPIEWNAYNLPYHFYPQPPSVLILGSGMGNDVAAALRNGAGHITAVEIDPLILKLGKQLHFEKPQPGASCAGRCAQLCPKQQRAFRPHRFFAARFSHDELSFHQYPN